MLAQYTGLTMVEIMLQDVKTKHPEIAAFNSRGKLFALSDHKGIMAQLNGDGNTLVYLSFKAAKEWLDTCGIPFDQPQEVKMYFLNNLKTGMNP